MYTKHIYSQKKTLESMIFYGASYFNEERKKEHKQWFLINIFNVFLTKKKLNWYIIY